MHRALVFTLALLATASTTLADTAKEPTHTEQLARKLIIPSIDLDGASLITAVEFLQSRARQLDPKLKAINITISDQELATRIIDELKLRHVSFHYALTAFAEHTGTTVEFDEDSIVFKPADPAAKPDPAKPDPNSATAAKAKAMIIPVISFENVWLAEATDFFRMRSLELDHERKGINIRILGKDLAKREIKRLQLSDVSLQAALTAMAEATNCTVQFREKCIIFTPKPEKK